MIAVEAMDVERQYLTFSLGADAFAIDILQVKEIRGWEKVRVIPETPAYVKGVLNLRGVIVPIIDLRERFKLASREYTATTVIIILAVNINDKEQTMGIVVDAVSDVLQINENQIKATPNLGSKINTEFIGGMIPRERGMLMLLDADHLLDPEQFELLDESTHTSGVD